MIDFTGGDKRYFEETASAEAPRATQLVLYQDPVSGKTSLVVDSLFFDKFVGWERDVSEALRAELHAYLYDPVNLYRHEWQVGDLVIWNNVALQHARPELPPTGERTHRRVGNLQDGHDRVGREFQGLGAPVTTPVVVTGAAGFIGSHVTRALVEQGASVIATDVRTTLPEPVLSGLDTSRVSYVSGDLRREETLDDLVEAAGERANVVHAAALLRYSEMAGALGQGAPSFPGALEVFDVNAMATWRLCSNSRPPAG